MKSLIKKIANTKAVIFLRNTLNFKPVYTLLPNKKYAVCISDSFIWRTDNGFITKFKYTDIINLFYKSKNSWVEFHFYSKDNKLLKKNIISDLNLSNELLISPEYLDNLKDYGVFHIYHFTNDFKSIGEKDIISNTCYIGFSKDNCLYSFIHGNVEANYRSIDSSNKKISSDIIKTSWFKNKEYTIQKYFDGFDKNELVLTNPTSNKIKFSIENNDYILKPNCTIIFEVKNPIVSIKSNCMLFRPIIFSYKDKYLDVHHG